MRLMLLTTFATGLFACHIFAQAPVAAPAAVSDEVKKLKGFWKCESIQFGQ